MKSLTQKDLEKEFTSISTLFVGKETEDNWEKRDAAVRNLREILNSNDLENWRNLFIVGIHNVISEIIKAIHSLRSSVALEALALISDLSIRIGDGLDLYTIEIILLNLLKCCSTTRKIIVSKSNDVTNLFLSRTHFHLKVISLLCKNTNDKNIQVRKSSAVFLKTILQTHGVKEHTRLAIGKPEISPLIQQFLMKGLSDASPAVREACRQAYWAYHEHWPNQAKKICLAMDATTLRQLEKSNTRSNPASPVPSFSRSNSSSSIPIASSIPKKPSLKRSSSMAENKKTPSIPSTSNEVKKNFSLQKLSRLSHISNASAPTAPVAYNLNKQLTPIAKRQTKSDFHQRSALESASILQMLKSKDKRQKCSSILKLSEKLHNTVYNPHSTATLPPYVPSKLDLLPILMDYITRRDLESEVYQTLMSWESLAGIFVYVMSVNYYAPTLIIADQQCRNNRDKSNMVNILSKGLKRMKMFLKRNDPELALKLLNLLKSTEDVQKSKLIDYSVKRDIQLFPHYKESLQIGLLEWIEEILCDFIGLPQDEDAETLMEGSRWLNASLQEFTADQWFGEDENMQLTIDYIVYLATSAKQPSLVAALKSIASHLKIANEELYRKTVKSSGKDAAAVLMEYFEDNQSMGTVDLEDVAGELMVQDMDFSIMDKLEEYNENTGMTQEISSLNINPAMHLINNDTNYQDNQVLPTQDSPKVLQDKNVVRDNPQTSMTRPPDSPKPTVIRANDENTPIASDPVLMSQNDGGMQPRVKLSRPASNQNISVDDIHLNKKPKHNQENQILAAPVKRKNPTRSNLSANASLRLDTLQTGINKIRSNDVDVALLIGLQQLSAEAPILDIYNIEEDSKFWLSNYAEPFRSLLNELIKLIDTKETIDEPVKVEVIELIRQLINNQKALFMRFSKVIVKGEAHQIAYLVKTLIREDVDMFNKISPIAEDTIIALLSIYSTEVSLRLLWDLIGQYAEANGKEKNRLLFYIDVINKK